jgi:acyl carrier protein
MRFDNVDVVVAAVRDLAAAGALPAELADVTLDGGTTLDSLGLDSMARLELLAELEERADVHIPESYLSGLRTLGDLAATLDVVRRAA